MVRSILGVALLAASVAGHAAPVEDAAHRLDRLETQRLNQAAFGKMTPPVASRPAAATGATDLNTAGEEALRAREERAISDWRRDQARCRKDARDTGC